MSSSAHSSTFKTIALLIDNKHLDSKLESYKLFSSALFCYKKRLRKHKKYENHFFLYKNWLKRHKNRYPFYHSQEKILLKFLINIVIDLAFNSQQLSIELKNSVLSFIFQKNLFKVFFEINFAFYSFVANDQLMSTNFKRISIQYQWITSKYINTDYIYIYIHMG